MTTKEKAKAYDEIIARAKKYLEDCPDRVDARGCIEHLIPELKESEDERIRKEIINHLISFNNGCYKIPSKDIIDNWIAWLEKQGEHAKFRNSIQVGDKVTRNQDGVLVNLSQLNRVAKKYEKQGEQKQHLELKAGKWYICYRAYCCRADSLTVREGERFMCEKDGVVKGFVIKEPEKYFKEVCAPVPIEDEQKLADKVKPKFKIGDVIKHKGADDSYKIIGVTDDSYICDKGTFVIKNQDIMELAEQDPCKDCTSPNCYFCEHNEHEEIKRMEEVMQNSEWSEEDEKLYQSALWHIKNSCGNQGKTSGEYEVYHFVKSLKDRIQPQPKQEWSEEDEMIYQHCLVILHDYGYDNWLKSFYLQNTWKPSDEQMEALRIAKVYPSSERREILETLYTDLEQLKAL